MIVGASRTRRALALTVACPVCGAEPGKECTSMVVGALPRPLLDSHPPRVDAAGIVADATEQGEGR